MENLIHYGCYFHYLKNIRKFLVCNKYTNNENIDIYNYIINKVLELPFKIDKQIHKEINKIFKKKFIRNLRNIFQSNGYLILQIKFWIY